MAKILVISGHPHMERSIANKTILDTLKASGKDIAIDDLDAKGCDIDVAAEQEALKAADTIVFQFPVYWFTCPALLKHWMEEVFTPGFAHGEGATGLKGKKFIISATIGAPEVAYTPAAIGHSIEEFFYIFQSMAGFTGMIWENPVLSYGCMFIPGVNTEADKEALIAKAKEHGEKLLQVLGE